MWHTRSHGPGMHSNTNIVVRLDILMICVSIKTNQSHAQRCPDTRDVVELFSMVRTAIVLIEAEARKLSVELKKGRAVVLIILMKITTYLTCLAWRIQ